MSLVADLVLGMSDQAHQRFGVAAALGVLRAAIDRDIAHTDRRTLLLRAMGLSLASSDARAFASFVERWASSGGDDEEQRGLSLVARLHEQDRAREMTLLATAEVQRFRSPDALFVLAVAMERDGDAKAARSLFADAAALAGATGDAVTAVRAERELLRVALSPARDREAVTALDSASPVDALRLAPAALTARGLYTRVRVLDRITELARDAAHRAVASRIALRHADSHGPRLSSIERDRVASILEHAGVDAAIVRELQHGVTHPEPFRARARAALSGNLLGPTPSDPHERRDWLGLVALAALARSEPGAASAPLHALAREPAAAIPWTAAMTALASTAVRAEALACVAAWIDQPVSPPRGYVPLARELDRAGAHDLVERALAHAASRNEPGAREELAHRIEARAREAYARGDLTEARSLALEAAALE